MPFIPFANTVRAALTFISLDQVCVNVFHYMVDEGPSMQTMMDLGDGLITWWTTNLRAEVHSGVTLYQVEVINLTQQNAPGVIRTTGLPLAGTSSSAAMPNNVTVAISWKTSLRGRSFRGRTYHIGLTESNCENNYLTTAFAASLQTAYEDLLAINTDVGPAVLVVASRQYNGVVRTNGVATIVESCVVDRGLDSMRKRLPGR